MAKPAGRAPEDEEEYKKWMDEFRNRSVQKQAETAVAAPAPTPEPPVQVTKPAAKMVTSKPPAHVLAGTSGAAPVAAPGPKPALIPIQPKPSAVSPISPRSDFARTSLPLCVQPNY